MPPTPKARATALAKVLRRRVQWLEENGPCCRCGGSHDLQVHHRDPKEKTTHRIWSFSAARRREELGKCEVLCRACHIAFHSVLLRKAHGIGGYRRGCRCEICRGARRAQSLRARQRHERRSGGVSFRDRYVVIHDDETDPAAAHLGENHTAD